MLQGKVEEIRKNSIEGGLHGWVVFHIAFQVFFPHNKILLQTDMSAPFHMIESCAILRHIFHMPCFSLQICGKLLKTFCNLPSWRPCNIPSLMYGGIWSSTPYWHIKILWMGIFQAFPLPQASHQRVSQKCRGYTDSMAISHLFKVIFLCCTNQIWSILASHFLRNSMATLTIAILAISKP